MGAKSARNVVGCEAVRREIMMQIPSDVLR